MFYLVDGRGGSKSRSKCHSWSWLGDQVTSLKSEYCISFFDFLKRKPFMFNDHFIFFVFKIPSTFDRLRKSYITKIKYITVSSGLLSKFHACYITKTIMITSPRLWWKSDMRQKVKAHQRLQSQRSSVFW